MVDPAPAPEPLPMTAEQLRLRVKELEAIVAELRNSKEYNHGEVKEALAEIRKCLKELREAGQGVKPKEAGGERISWL